MTTGIVRRGTYHGINWYISISAVGIHCAYICLPQKVFETEGEVDETLEIHGGCTYFMPCLPWESTEDNEKQVIGWDYGHMHDICFGVSFFNKHNKIGSFASNVKDEEVIINIKNAIDGILKLYDCKIFK